MMVKIKKYGEYSSNGVKKYGESPSDGDGTVKYVSFDKFISDWENNILPKDLESRLRKGQSLMNYLSKIWKKEYDRITDGFYTKRIDCFYTDKIVPSTVDHLEKIWDNSFPH